MLLEHTAHGIGIANVDIVVLVFADGLQQVIARRTGGRFRTEEAAAHIVINPDDRAAFLREVLDGF